MSKKSPTPKTPPTFKNSTFKNSSPQNTTSKQILLSVIIPVYNNAPYLPRCLDSVLHQNLHALSPSNIEIICVNDCSTDHSEQILKDYAAKHPHLKILNTPKNSGQSAARNLALQHASGDFIMFCDGDDYYSPEMCETMYRAITDHKVDLAACALKVIYESDDKLRLSDNEYYALKFAGRHLMSDDIILTTDLAPTTKIYRRSLLEKYQLRFPEGLHFEDAYFNVAYMRICRSVYFVNQKLYFYIRHHGSVMSTTFSQKSSVDFAIDHVKIAFLVYDFFRKNHLLADHTPLFWKLYRDYAAFAIGFSKTESSREAARTLSRRFASAHRTSYRLAPLSTRLMIDINNSRLKSEIYHFFLRLSLRLKIARLPRLSRLQNWTLKDLHQLTAKTHQLRVKVQDLRQDLDS